MSKVVPLTYKRPRVKPSAPRTLFDTAKSNNVVSMHPAKFESTIDVIGELEHDQLPYRGKDNFAIQSLPGYVHTSLDRVRSRVISTHKPGLNPTICCCLYHGLTTLQGNEDIQSLLNLKYTLDNTDNVDASDVEEISGWFRHFSIGIPDTALSGSRRRNITIPDHTKANLMELSSELGMSAAALSILAMMIVLEHQEPVLRDHQRMMSGVLDTWQKRIFRRRMVAEVLLKTL